jgi:peroxiredoxin (alkyl hydroperoxide reductase subunit C)
VATPEGWCPGEKVIVPPPATAKDAEARSHAGYEYVDWYFSKTDIAKATPKSKKRTPR